MIFDHPQTKAIYGLTGIQLMRINNVQVLYPGEIGIYLTDIDRVTINNYTVIHSGDSWQLYIQTLRVSASVTNSTFIGTTLRSMAGVYAGSSGAQTTLLVQYCSFTNTSGIQFPYGNLTVDSNTFNGGANFAIYYYNTGSGNNWGTITNNKFTGMNAVVKDYWTVHVDGYWGSNFGMTVLNNIWENCTLPFLLWNSPGWPSVFSNNQIYNSDASTSGDRATVQIRVQQYSTMTITNNRIVNNTSPLAALYVDGGGYEPFFIANNTITNNNVIGNTRAAVMVSGWQMRFVNNSFENPACTFEMDSFGTLSNVAQYQINAAGNFWGTGAVDDFAIHGRIIDAFRLPNLIPVQFHPYCLNRGCSSVSANVTSYAFINNGTVLGGFLINQNATVAAGTYTCYGVYVSPGTNLTIAPGVTCRHILWTSIWVDGTISLAGTRAAPITFTSAKTAGAAAGDWGRVYIRSNAGLVAASNLIVRYCGTERASVTECFGIDYTSPATISNITIQSGAAIGLRQGGSSGSCTFIATFSNISVSSCATIGMHVAMGSGCASLDRISSTFNGAEGIWIDSGTVNITASSSTDNGFNNTYANSQQGSGLTFWGAGWGNSNLTILNSDFSRNNRYFALFFFFSHYFILPDIFFFLKRYGIYWLANSANSQMTVIGCTITFNGINNYSPLNNWFIGALVVYSPWYQDNFLTVRGNTISNNYNGAFIAWQFRTSVLYPEYYITGNTFNANNCSSATVCDTILFVTDQATPAYVVFKDNLITNNVAARANVFLWYTSGSTDPNSMLFTNNTMTNNIAGSLNATLATQSDKTPIHCNYFNNPSNNYELYCAGAGTNLNVTFNFWGPTVLTESRVIERMWDAQDSASSASTVYFPWLLSANCSNVGWNATRLPWITNNNIAGVLYADTTIGPGNYTVAISAAVDTGVKLTILPNTCIFFLPGAAMEIRGTIIANGTASQKICFDIHPNATSSQYWGRLWIRTGSNFDSNGLYSSGSYFNNVIVRRGGLCGGSSCGVIRVEGTNHVAMENTKIAENWCHGLEIATTGFGYYRNMNISFNGNWNNYCWGYWSDWV